MRNDLSFIVPILNEEQHLTRLIPNLLKVTSKIFVVDSGSSDSSIKIVESFGCKWASGSWESFSAKLNWAIESNPYQSRWVMRVDADEFLSDELIEFINKFSLTDGEQQQVNMISVQKSFHFMGHQIKHGGYGNLWVDRIFRPDQVRYEERLTDEHLIGVVRSARIKAALVEDSLRELDYWLLKHVHYARSDAKVIRNSEGRVSSQQLHGISRIKRVFKERIYYRSPLFLRALLFWIYRYFILLGFLDGRVGVFFHFYHALSYRMMVDGMLLEREKDAV